MNEVIRAGYAERAPKDNPKSWYLPHHGVYHPKKPGKIRVVFDCSAEFEGHSLNRQLLQGPDLTNSLLGVLCRFCPEPVAFACDIEGMFHQVNVNEEHRDYLRFLWWDQGDITKEPTEYRMTVHLFGAASSPGCANLALKTTAEDNEKDLGSEAAEFLSKNFYVDDGLNSVKTVKEAIALIQKSKEMSKQGGFRLHKFISNRKEVIESIPAEDRAKGIKDLDLEHKELPSERVLGIEWCVESDAFQFRITLKDKPFTRQGILSTVSSIYDPLGFAAPFLLQGKRIRVQHLTNEFWTRWRKEFLHALQERQKWVSSRRNMQIGDIVLVKDDNTPCNQWQLARVTEAQRGNDGLVRKVNLAIGDRQLTASGKRTKAMSILERPIHKLVLLVPFNSHERPGVPDEEPDHDP